MCAYKAPTGDFVTSTITTGTLVAGATSMTIGSGLTLPATNGILQVDYDSAQAVGAANGPETISYATYTSGTGAVGGITRGVAGTTDVNHANGAKVQSAPSSAYWGSGSLLSADIGAVIKNANLDTTAGDIGGAWKAWTPTFTNLTVGAGGTLAAYYTQIGKTIIMKVNWVFGTGSGVTGSITFTLPVTSKAMTNLDVIGTSMLIDSGGGYDGTVLWRSTTTASVHPKNSAGTYTTVVDTSSSVPFTWGTGDSFTLTAVYEAA